MDFRQTNQVKIKYTYLLPIIDEIIDKLVKAKYFSILNAFIGCYQIQLEERDMRKTAYAQKGGLYNLQK